SPSPGAPLLGGALDVSEDPGFQIDFVVRTDADNAGRDIRLSIDGDTGLTLPAAPGGGGASATFAAVTLSEAEHGAQAFCADAAGNVQATPLTSWTVDLTACAATLLVADGHDPIVPSDDLEPGVEGLQVSVAGLASGDGCSAARVGPCDALGGEFSALEPSGSFALEATLPG